MAKKKSLNGKFETTKEIKLNNSIINQVIGQEHAVSIIRKAATQRRHVLLIGEPGTGKSMLGMGLAELLPKEKLKDILSFPNINDEHNPLIRTLSAGKGREFLMKSSMRNFSWMRNMPFFLIVFGLIMQIVNWHAYSSGLEIYGTTESARAIVFAANLITLTFVMGILVIVLGMNRRGDAKQQNPKVIVDNYNKKQSPFYDATGAHAGALLGDVLHDPFQSGAGMIHKADMGVLFIDEIATLQPNTQQELLSAIQEGKYAITGQSERSAGAMVRTEPTPCRFVLVAAGNVETIKHMHPALRSRIRGYGYEINMENDMPDNAENRSKIARFIAQEVVKDKKIPHFSKDAVEEIIVEAKRRSGRKGRLTLRLRELGGLVRAAGDLAFENGKKLVTGKDVIEAKNIARTLEKQMADKFIEIKKEYEVIKTSGIQIGRVNGLAVLSGGGPPYSGLIMPIEAEVTKGGEKTEVNATGKLGEIAKESVINVSALIKRIFGEDLIGKYDIYVQFLQSHEGTEGDSASIAMATAIVSSLKNIP